MGYIASRLPPTDRIVLKKPGPLLEPLGQLSPCNISKCDIALNFPVSDPPESGETTTGTGQFHRLKKV